jgi:hypothetical protein
MGFHVVLVHVAVCWVELALVFFFFFLKSINVHLKGAEPYVGLPNEQCI